MNSIIEPQEIVKMKSYQKRSADRNSWQAVYEISTRGNPCRQVSADEFKTTLDAIKVSPTQTLNKISCQELGYAYEVAENPAPKPWVNPFTSRPPVELSEVAVTLGEAQWLAEQEKAARVPVARRRSPLLIQKALARQAVAEKEEAPETAVTSAAAGDGLANELFPEPTERHPAYALADKGTAAIPEQGDRMQKAADLVANDKVKVHVANEYDVIGTVHNEYSITPGACTCSDFTHRGGWCKHRLAVRMAIALQQQPEAVPFGSDIPVRIREEKEQARLAAKVERDKAADKKSRDLYYNSQYGAQRYVIAAVANGAQSIKKEKLDRAYGGA